MKAILNPSKSVMSVVVRHYTKHSLSLWLELWQRQKIKVVYTTAEWEDHHSHYGDKWIEFELKLQLNQQVPYQMGLQTSPSDEWGMKEDKGWFHTPVNMMRIIRISK